MKPFTRPGIGTFEWLISCESYGSDRFTLRGGQHVIFGNPQQSS